MFKRNRDGYVVPRIETGSFLKNLRKIMFAGWGLSSCIAKTRQLAGLGDNLRNIRMTDVISPYYAQIRSTHLSCRLRRGGNLSLHSGQIISSKLTRNFIARNDIAALRATVFNEARTFSTSTFLSRGHTATFSQEKSPTGRTSLGKWAFCVLELT